jgi:hypothetical protein
VNEAENVESHPTGDQRPPDEKPPAPAPPRSEAELVRLYARIGLSDADIAACLDLSRTAVRKKYRRRLKKWRAQRRATLRKFQMEQASKSPLVINALIREEFGQEKKAQASGGFDAEPRLDEKMG